VPLRRLAGRNARGINTRAISTAGGAAGASAGGRVAAPTSRPRLQRTDMVRARQRVRASAGRPYERRQHHVVLEAGSWNQRCGRPLAAPTQRGVRGGMHHAVSYWWSEPASAALRKVLRWVTLPLPRGASIAYTADRKCAIPAAAPVNCKLRSALCANCRTC
jgi:hypothetical protein